MRGSAVTVNQSALDARAVGLAVNCVTFLGLGP